MGRPGWGSAPRQAQGRPQEQRRPCRRGQTIIAAAARGGAICKTQQRSEATSRRVNAAQADAAIDRASSPRHRGGAWRWRAASGRQRPGCPGGGGVSRHRAVERGGVVWSSAPPSHRRGEQVPPPRRARPGCAAGRAGSWERHDDAPRHPDERAQATSDPDASCSQQRPRAESPSQLIRGGARSYC